MRCLWSSTRNRCWQYIWELTVVLASVFTLFRQRNLCSSLWSYIYIYIYIYISLIKLHLSVVLTLPPGSHTSTYLHLETWIIYDDKLPFSGAILTWYQHHHLRSKLIAFGSLLVLMSGISVTEGPQLYPSILSVSASMPTILEGVAGLWTEWIRTCKHNTDKWATASVAMNGWSEYWQYSNTEYKTKSSAYPCIIGDKFSCFWETCLLFILRPINLLCKSCMLFLGLCFQWNITLVAVILDTVRL